MSIVNYNQKGYKGASMSVRAYQAYDNGEMPKSKWSKKAIIESILDKWDSCSTIVASFDFVNLKGVTKLTKVYWNGDCMLTKELNVLGQIIDQKYTKKDLESLLHWSSWHHTSKFANPTDFYEIDEDRLADFILNDVDLLNNSKWYLSWAWGPHPQGEPSIDGIKDHICDEYKNLIIAHPLED